MKRIWILGIGPLIVPKLFYVDIKRVDLYIDKVLIPRNVYVITEKIYTIFEDDYYYYLQFISQTLGNAMFDLLKTQYKNNHLTCKKYVLYVDSKKKQIEAKMCFAVFDMSLKWIKNINASSKVSKTKSTSLINF